MVIRVVYSLILLCLYNQSSFAVEKTIGVYVALADNEHQGILPVPKAIGNGDDPEKNLYWGTADGLKGFFDRSKEWKLTEKNDTGTNVGILRTRVYHHIRRPVVLRAFAYKGTAIKQCIQDYENAISSGTYDMVVYIGHNGLMDFDLPRTIKSAKQTRTPDCVVLCCKSEQYFKSRIESAGGRPLLLTTQFMYPGAFILHAIVGDWLAGKDYGAIRASAGAAYAANQRIVRKAGIKVFADAQETQKVRSTSEERIKNPPSSKPHI